MVSGRFWSWNGGAVKLVFWVDLGAEMEVILLGVGALVWMEKKRKKRAEFSMGKEKRNGWLLL